MAHPTVHFFCIEEDGDYKMVRFGMRRYPRPADLEGSHPYFDDPKKLTISLWNSSEEEVNLVCRDHHKVTLETWTAPDCIFSKADWGRWSNFGNRILENVKFLKGEYLRDGDYLYYQAEFQFDTMGTSIFHETVNLPITDEEFEHKPLRTRPRPTPDIIKEQRGLYTIKPDIIVVKYDKSEDQI